MRNDRQPALPMPDPALAAAYRQAADTARYDPFFTPEQREARAAYYESEAARLDPPKEHAA